MTVAYITATRSPPNPYTTLMDSTQLRAVDSESPTSLHRARFASRGAWFMGAALDPVRALESRGCAEGDGLYP